MSHEIATTSGTESHRLSRCLNGRHSGIRALVGVAVLLCVVNDCRADEAANEATITELRRVWDKAPHNAFTDLIRFKGHWYLSFREAKTHFIPKPGEESGKLRVLRSLDGIEWKSVALLDDGKDRDIRDGHLCVTPDNRLMLVAAAAPHTHGESDTRQPLVWFSKDGESWSTPTEVGELDWWLWRVEWGPDGKAYGVGYGPITRLPRRTRLYRSTDGIRFETLIKTFTRQPHTGETVIRFLKNGTAVALVRRDGPEPIALVGTAQGDYRKWDFKPLGQKIGGPGLLVMPDGRLLAGCRLYNGKVRRTSLCWLDPVNGTLSEFLELPSGGDTGYPGLVWHGDQLWVSYYSSHEEKTAIYLAKVHIDLLPHLSVKPGDE